MIRAIHFPDYAEFRNKRLPGSFHVPDAEADGSIDFWYHHPDGTTGVTFLLVGNGFKPEHPQSAMWNGSVENPTLTRHIPNALADGAWRLEGGYWVERR